MRRRKNEHFVPGGTRGATTTRDRKGLNPRRQVLLAVCKKRAQRAKKSKVIKQNNRSSARKGEKIKATK